MAWYDEYSEDYGEDQDPQYPWTFAQYPDLMAARQTEEDPDQELLRWMHEQGQKRKVEEEQRRQSASDHSPWESFSSMFTVPNAMRTGGQVLGGIGGGLLTRHPSGVMGGAAVGAAIGDMGARWYSGEEQNPYATGVEALFAGGTAPLGLAMPGKGAGAKALWNFAKSQAGVSMLDAGLSANPRKMAEEGIWDKQGNINMVSPWEMLGQMGVGGVVGGTLGAATGKAGIEYGNWKGSPYDVQPPPGFQRPSRIPLEEGMPGREPIFPKLPKETQPANPATTGEGLIPPVRPPEGFSQVQDLPGVADDFSLVANVGTSEAKAVQHPWVAKAMQQVDNPIDYENNIAGQMRRANPRTTDRDIADFIETHPFVPQAETQAPTVFPPTTLDEGRNVAQQAMESDVTPEVNLPGQEDIDAAIGRGDRQITDLLNTAPVSSAMHTQAPRQEFEELVREIREARDLKDSLRADPIKANDAFLSRIPPTDPGTLAFLAQQGTITPEEASAIQNYQRAGREQQTRPGFNFATQNQPGGMDPPVAPPIHGDLGGPPVEAPNFDIAGMAEKSRQAEARPDTQRGDFQEQLRAGVTENNADLTRLTGVRDAALEEASNIIDPVRKGDAILRYISENVPDGADLDFMRLTGLLDKNQLHAIIQMRRAMREAGDPGITGFAGGPEPRLEVQSPFEVTGQIGPVQPPDQPLAQVNQGMTEGPRRYDLDDVYRRQVEGADIHELFRMARERGIDVFGRPNDEIRRLLLEPPSATRRPNPPTQLPPDFRGGGEPLGPVQNPLTPQAGGGSGGALPPVEPPVLPPDETPDLPPQRPENSVSDMASAARQIAIDEDQYRSALRTEIMRNGFPRPTEAELDEVIKDNPWKNPILEDSYIEALGKVKSQREYSQRVREYDQLLDSGEITREEYDRIFDKFSEMRAQFPLYDDFNHMMEDVPGEIAEQARDSIAERTGVERRFDDGLTNDLDLDGTPEEAAEYRDEIKSLMQHYGVKATDEELTRFTLEHPFIEPADHARQTRREGERVITEATEGAFDFGTNGVSEETLDALIEKAKALSTGALGGRRNSAASKSVGTRIMGVLMEARKVSKSDDPVVRGAKFAQHMADNLTESQINSLRQIGFPADQIRLIQMYKAVPMENVDPVRQAAAQIKDIGDEMDSGIAEFRDQLDHGEPPVVDVKGMAGKVESPIPIRKDAPEGIADSVKRERTRLEGVFRGMVEETANIADPVQKGKAKLDYLRENLTDRELEHARFLGIITDQEHASIANATRKAFTDAEINDQNPVELFPAEKVSPEERAGFQSRLEAETAERNRVQAERQAQGQPTPNEEATRGFRAERQRIQEAVNSGEMSIDEANRRLTAIEASEKANREQPVEKQPLRSFKLSAEENSSPFKGSDLEDFLSDVPETGNPEFDSRIARMREIAAMDKLDDEGALKEEFRQLWTEIRKHPDAPPGFRGEYTLADPRPGTGKAGRPASNHYESPPADVQAERRRVEKAYRFAEIKQDEYKARMAELRAMSSGSSGQTPPVGNVQVPPNVPPPVAAGGGGGGSVPPVSPPMGGGGGGVPPNVPPPNPAGGFGNMPYGPGGQGRFGTAVNPTGFRTKLHAALVKAPTDAAFKWWVNHREAAQSFGGLIGNKFKKFDNVSFTQYQQNPQAYPEVHDYFADWHRDLTNAGVKMGQKDSYLPQLWENPQAVAQLPQTQQNRLLLKPGFTFNAMVQNYEEGIKQGLIPKFKTISELGNFYETAARKAMADRQFFEYLKQNKLIKPRGAKGSGGWQPLNLDIFPTAMLGKKPTTWVISPQFSAGKTLVKGKPRMGREAIENYLTEDKPIYDKIANFASNLKNLRLVGGVPFTGINQHGWHTMTRWLASSDQRTNDFVTGAGYLINPRAARRKLASYGAALPDARAHGLTVTGDDFDADKFLRPGSPRGVLERTNHALDKIYADPLFRNIIPALKMSRYEGLASQYIKPGMNAQQIAAAKNQAAQEVNALFGGINWKELGESKHTQNLLRTFALAPDWLRTNTQGGKRMYNALLDPNSKESKMYLRMGANLIAATVTASAMNKTMTGRWSHENDSGHEMDIAVGKDSKGKIIYIRPFGTAADFARLPLQAVKALTIDQEPGQIPQMARNRTSIPVGKGLDWYGGNFRGEKLFSDRYGKKKDYPAILKGLLEDASDLLPNPVEAPIDWMRGSTSGQEAVSRMFEAPLGFAMPKDGQGKGRKRIQRKSVR